MSKEDKKKEQTAMDQLFAGLVNPDDTAAKSSRSPGRPAKPAEDKAASTHMTSQIDSDLMYKVRYISNKEGLTIRQILEAALGHAISRYEDKNGTITVRQPKNKKRDAGEVFGL